MEYKNEHFRHILFFYFRKGKNAAQAAKKIRDVYGDQSHNTGLQGFVVGNLWVVSGVIFDVGSESGIRISLSRQDSEILEVMCSKNGVFRYF